MSLKGAPGLIIGEQSEPAPGPADPVAPGVDVCRDAQGGVFAYCRIVNGRPRVDVPGLATFCYEGDPERVRALPHRPLRPDLVLDTYHRRVLPMMLPALGTEVLHASAVIAPGGVAAFCGVSGTGKSTLAMGLARRGLAIWADDAVAIDTSGPRPRTIPLPFEVRLRPASARFFGGGGEPAAPARVAPASAEPLPLAVICVLQRTPAATDVTVERLDAASACLAALAHAYCFSLEDREQKRRMIIRYLRLTGRVPIYKICFRPGLAHLATLLDSLEAVVGRERVA